MQKGILLSLLLLITGGLGFAASAAEPTNGVSAQLYWVNHAVTNLNEVELVVTLTNTGSTNLTFRTVTDLVSVNVFNAKGEIVPPTTSFLPVPNNVRTDWQLSVGASTTVKYKLKGYPEKVPPGRYRIQLRLIPSNEVVCVLQ